MSSITSASSKLRLTGMATGIDTDAAIKQMMSAYYSRVDKEKQKQQIIEWKQEAYRDFIGQINSLKSKYFDVLSKDYILSDNSFSAFKVTQTGNATNAITAKATTGTLAGNYSIKVISDDIATKAALKPTKSVNVKEATSGVAFPVVIKHVDDTSNNDMLTVTDKSGNTHNVTITSGTYSDLNQLAAQINKDMANIDIGSDKKLSDDIKAVVKDNTIKFFQKITIDDSNKELAIDINGTTQKITIDAGSYTMEELASKITSKLSGGYKATSSDGLTISFSKDDAPVSGTAYFGTVNEANKISAGSVSLQRPTGVSNADTFSNLTINQNSLSFDKRIITGVNDTLTFNVFNGSGSSATPTTITLDAGEYDISSLVTAINTKLGDTSTIRVAESADGKILFKSTTGDQITITGNAASTLGITEGFKIDQSTSDKMINVITDSGIDLSKVAFTINGKEYLYDFTSTNNTTKEDGKTYIGAKNKTISDILNDISKGSNVDISYSQLDRKFYMTSKETGSNQDIAIIDSSNFITNIFGTATATKGTDVVVEITEPSGASNTIIQSSNNFTIDGINYTLNSKPTGTEPITFEVQGSVDDTFNKIKGFIDSYNELISNISSKIEEKKQYTYEPLTDEQKEEMTDEQIEKWEKKAKQGILSGDSTLEAMLNQMRMAFFEEVEGVGISLFEIGLNTSSDISQRGKIIIDEEKLKKALENDPDKVMNLFIKKSSTYKTYSRSMSSGDRKVRYKEEGIFNRISDIIEDNVSTFRDSNGKKGILLEIAGIKGDFTEYQNMLTDQIYEREAKINDLLDKIYEKEERYYEQFAKLEAAMNKMNAQTSWLYSQLGMS
ncbi:flagellar filament capping protein FliD [Clostridium colicanis]|uniref:Flagellar hook-associated protein 2 n=1 Tax=Clostridium colicanis DSM 13634 TaxID=1121305 RepID=A0A151AR67_9CLOT|nr:flagellar filament capping protein FliD [Clostridium colicanis]KYH30070.1 flagellar capping protein [Clostridium colicanis DSM 13634]